MPAILPAATRRRTVSGMLLSSAYNLFSFAAFVATAIVAASSAGLLSQEQFDVAYSPFAWGCYNVVGFVLMHEAWIESFYLVRVVIGIVVPRGDLQHQRETKPSFRATVHVPTV